MAGSPLKNLKMFGKLCGDGAIRNVILATTMWRSLDKYFEDKHLRRERELRENYWKPMIDCGSTMTRFLKTYHSAWTIVDLISVTNTPHPLLIQEELVDLGMGVCETQAGITLYETLRIELANQKDAVKKLRKEAGAQYNAELVRELTLQCEELERTLRATFAQTQELKIPPGRQIYSLFSFKKTRAVSYPFIRVCCISQLHFRNLSSWDEFLYSWVDEKDIFACVALA